MVDYITQGLLYGGAVVKDDPAANPVDLVLSVESSTPILSESATPVYTPINPPPAVNVAEVPGPTVVPIDQPLADKKTMGAALAVVGLGALLIFASDKKRVGSIGKKGKGKKSILPLLLVGGAAAYYFYNKNQESKADPEAAGLVVVPGLAKLTDTMRDAVFQRAKSWVNPIATDAWYPEIYRDVLTLVLPQYADIFKRMTNEENNILYAFVIDHPAGLLQSENQQLYNQVEALKAKYQLTFY